ncbi:hypothetical protein AB0K43_30905 [Kitasatospora sp. NPDC049258]
MAPENRSPKPSALPARLLAALVIASSALWLLGELYARLTK